MKTDLKAIIIFALIMVATGLFGFSLIPDKNDYQLIHEMREVKRGETLWSIAAEYQDKSDISEDIRAIMYEIEMMNPAMSHGQVYVGDKLRVYYWRRK